MTKFSCYFITPDNKAEVCFFVEAASARDAAAEAKARFQGSGYAALEIWNGPTCELTIDARTSTDLEPVHAGSNAADILLVDDEKMVRAITADLLRDEGFTVTEAASGDEALDKLAAGLRFDVLLTDVRMPGMSGFELANRLAPTCPATKVIYLTGYPVKESRPLDVMRPGAELLHKPVPIERLAGAVRRALGRN